MTVEDHVDEIDGLFAVASNHFQAGQIRQAEEVYQRILNMHPDNPRALHALGVIAFHKGNEEDAIELISRVLSLREDYADAHNSLGNILLKQGKHQQAAASYRSALTLNPELVIAHANLGNALRILGDLDAATESYRKALLLQPGLGAIHYALGIAYRDLNRTTEALHSLKKAAALMPDSADAHFQLGISFQERDQLEEAESCYGKAILLRPDHADALNNLGNILAATGRLEEAHTCYQRAVESRPDFYLSFNNLGNVLTEKGDYEKAAKSYRRAIDIRRDYADAFSNLGNVLLLLHQETEALDFCMKAVELEPDSPECRKNLGNVLACLGRFEEAIVHYRAALELLPGELPTESSTDIHPLQDGARNVTEKIPLAAEILFGLGNSYKGLHRFKEAAAHFRQATTVMPIFDKAYNNLGNVRKDQGRLDEALACYKRAVEVGRDCAEAHSNLIFAMNYSDAYSVRDILEESLRWDMSHGKQNEPRRRPHANSKDPLRKIRIGYVSSDFRRHPVGYFLLPVLPSHDREKFIIHCYSCCQQEDEITRRLKTASDCWEVVEGMGDLELAEMIRSAGIDILVDLSGHTAGNRLPMFTLEPAPIQVTWAGYVGTTGLSSMNYLLSDQHETPEGVDHLYVEEIIRLPNDYICYEPPAYAPSVSPLPMLRQDHCTFGCFNNLNKVTPGVVEIWSEILRLLPEARLLLVTGQLNDSETKDRYHRLFSDQGVATRVDLQGAVPHRELLRRYNDVDVALDPFPYSGGLTTLESLWMGVPVVTMAGERFAGRHSLTHLTNVGLQDLVAGNSAEYIKIAASLASNPAQLQKMRWELRARMAASPICDGRGFTRNLENTFQNMFAKWCT